MHDPDKSQPTGLSLQGRRPATAGRIGRQDQHVRSPHRARIASVRHTPANTQTLLPVHAPVYAHPCSCMHARAHTHTNTRTPYYHYIPDAVLSTRDGTRYKADFCSHGASVWCRKKDRRANRWLIPVRRALVPPRKLKPRKGMGKQGAGAGTGEWPGEVLTERGHWAELAGGRECAPGLSATGTFPAKALRGVCF